MALQQSCSPLDELAVESTALEVIYVSFGRLAEYALELAEGAPPCLSVGRDWCVEAAFGPVRTPCLSLGAKEVLAARRYHPQASTITFDDVVLAVKM